MRRRLLSFILAAALLLGMVPSLGVPARATTAYDAAAAVSYAKAHWNDGVGLCAQFVSKCLAAGGVTIPNKSCYSSTTASYENNRGALGKYTNPYLSSAALLLYLSERYQVITDPDWADIAVGDVVFMIGGSSGDKRDGHVGIIVKVTDGIPYYAAHNKATVTGRFYDSHPCTYVVKMSQASGGGSTGGGTGSDSGTESTCDCSVSYAGTYICSTESTELRIRSGHGTSYAKVGAIPKGATVTVTMSDGEWAHVEYNGVSGYASMDYLTLQTPAVTLAAEHWISGENMGSSIPGSEQGSTAFVCCRLYDANSGSDLSTAADGDFAAAITVYDPDGTIVQTGAFSNSDRCSVAVACQAAGTYTYTIEVSGDWEDTFTGTFSVSQKTYTITYNANGGSGAPGNQTKTYGTALTLSSAVPTRTGYTFQGWATSAGGSVAYQEGGSYTENANVTLYAVWKINSYTVIYNANGGSGAPGNQTKTHGTALTLSSAVPTRTGYTFQGWATSTAATTAAYEPGGSYTANSGCTLYAVWKANSYTVSYSSNGGSGAPLGQTKTHGVALTLSSTVPSREGYRFLGWATSATATTAQYQPGDTLTTNGNTVLYAVWKINNFTITYNANGGSGAPDSQTKNSGDSLTISSIIPTRTGYIFRGWATSTAATAATYQPGDVYTKDADCTLYALWQREKKACGDADGDGYVDAYDASLMKKYSVGAIDSSGLNLSVCDLDGDGYVDAYDASLAQKYSVGAIDLFPVEQ